MAARPIVTSFDQETRRVGLFPSPIPLMASFPGPADHDAPNQGSAGCGCEPTAYGRRLCGRHLLEELASQD